MTDYIFYFIICVFSLLILYLILPYIIGHQLNSSVLKRIGQSQSVCLTFDDGPDPSTTGKIIDLLNAHNVRATFFVLGKKAEIVKKLIYP